MKYDMADSKPRRLRKIKNLAKEYFDMDYGTVIEKHTQLFCVFTIRESIHAVHPHTMHRVYISRKSLKHIVESRKEQFEKYHTANEALEAIHFAIDNIQNTIINFTSYETQPPIRHVYKKTLGHPEHRSLRIVVECIEDKLEIVTIHFTKK